jgi:hypothetical protein
LSGDNQGCCDDEVVNNALGATAVNVSILQLAGLAKTLRQYHAEAA